MRIGGFQKLTLLDYPGEVACIVFTIGCDLRCPYCHNSGLLKDAPEFGEDEVFAYLEKRRGLLDGVVITGGEPLMHSDVFSFAEKIRGSGYKIKLDTNGTYPDRLNEMISRGLVDYVAMDVKHVPEKYHLAAGIRADVSAILRSIEILKASSVSYEFRTTVVKGIHAPEDIEGIAGILCADAPYYLQKYKASEGVLAPEGLLAYDDEEMLKMASAARTRCPNTSVRGL